ncbi:hypothetical protein AB0I81_40210 [Nonomuraea sp. NPDC050404]|uniref:hypothetical protein n=1 Tax=Nonomuraea sp. NPDC050404 TaxID=3155783 RepID=UPI0033F7317E
MPKSARLKLNIKAITAKEKDGAVKGLRIALEHLLGESRKIVPLEESTLSDSGVPSIDEKNLKGAVSYDTPYAVRQHEDMTLKHDEGRSAKYLEGPLREERDTMLELVAAQIRRSLR